MKKVKISSWGGALPKQKITNDEISTYVNTSNEWIVQRTGITQRFFAANDELTSKFALESALQTIGTRKHIDCIIIATTTPDRTMPSTACIVQGALLEHGITSNFAFDIQAVCAGFVYAIINAYSLIKAGIVQTALVIGSETLSRIVDFNDRSTCILFGDGAGSCIVEETEPDSQSYILATDIKSDGSLLDFLYTEGGISKKGSSFIKMKGAEVFKHAVSKMVSSIEDLVTKSGLQMKDIDHIVPHQANARILDAIAERINLSKNKIVKTVDIHANTSSATIPLAIVAEIERFKNGDNVIIEALGAGLTWGGVIFKY